MRRVTLFISMVLGRPIRSLPANALRPFSWGAGRIGVSPCLFGQVPSSVFLPSRFPLILLLLGVFLERLRQPFYQTILVTIQLMPPAALPGAKLLKSLTNRS